jgi:hypothetical protein
MLQRKRIGASGMCLGDRASCPFSTLTPNPVRAGVFIEIIMPTFRTLDQSRPTSICDHLSVGSLKFQQDSQACAVPSVAHGFAIKKKPRRSAVSKVLRDTISWQVVERMGIEPTTFALRTRRSPS